MSKPDYIDQEAWDSAYMSVEELTFESAPDEFLEIVEAIARAIMKAKADENEACVQACLTEAQGFMSPEYAANQPLGSICERFAIDECVRAIRKRLSP